MIYRIAMTLIFLAGVAVPAAFAQDTETSEIAVRVDGMSCMFCAYSLERNFEKRGEVEEIEINVEEGIAKIFLKPGTELSDEKIKDIVKNSGFTPGEIRRKETVNG